jgi:small-conductance mechanosensitive channel
MNEIWDKIANGVVNQFADGMIKGIPLFISALLVFIIGMMLARGVRSLLRRVLSGIGIDRFAERLNGIDLVQQSGMEIKLSSLIAQVVYFLLMLMFTIAATDVLGIPAITQMMRDLFNYLPSLLTAGVVLIFGIFVADMIKSIVHTACQSLGIPSAKLIASLVFYFLFLTIIVSALAQAKIHTDFIASNLTVVVGAGALAFAIGYGLASRDLMANYVAGYYNKNKVRIGDEVVIENVRGKVVLIDGTSLILQTPEKAIIVPLSKLTTEKVEVIYPDADDDQSRIESGPV